MLEPKRLVNWIDGVNGIGRHLRTRLNFAVIAEADIRHIPDRARARGWHAPRLVSSAGSPFKRDPHFQNADGGQQPGVSVFGRAADALLRPFGSGSAIMKENVFRGIDFVSPFWNLLDLTPGDRGEVDAGSGLGNGA